MLPSHPNSLNDTVGTTFETDCGSQCSWSFYIILQWIPNLGIDSYLLPPSEREAMVRIRWRLASQSKPTTGHIVADLGASFFSRISTNSRSAVMNKSLELEHWTSLQHYCYDCLERTKNKFASSPSVVSGKVAVVYFQPPRPRCNWQQHKKHHRPNLVILWKCSPAPSISITYTILSRSCLIAKVSKI